MRNKDKTRTKQGQLYILYILILLHLTGSVFGPPGEPPHWGQSIKWEPTLGPRPWRSFLNAPSVPDWDLLLSCWDLHQDPRVSQRCYLKNIWNLTLYHIVPLYKQFQNCRLTSNPFDCMLVLMMWIDDLRPLTMSYYLRFCVRTLWSWQRCASERNQQKQRFNRATAHPVSTFLRLPLTWSDPSAEHSFGRRSSTASNERVYYILPTFQIVLLFILRRLFRGFHLFLR